MSIVLAKGSIRESGCDKMDEMACGRAENGDSKSKVLLEVYYADDLKYSRDCYKTDVSEDSGEGASGDSMTIKYIHIFKVHITFLQS